MIAMIFLIVKYNFLGFFVLLNLEKLGITKWVAENDFFSMKHQGYLTMNRFENRESYICQCKSCQEA